MLINYNKKHDKYYDMLAKYYDRAIQVLNPPCKDLEVNVIMCSGAMIKRLNANFRQVYKVTDVLSFPTLSLEGQSLVAPYITKQTFGSDVNPATGNIMLGDIYICMRKVKAQARQYGNSLEREFSYLALHGLLHLFGYDHMVESDKKLMRAKEEEILGGLK